MKLRLIWSDGKTEAFSGKLHECWKWASQFTYRIAELFNSKGKMVGKWVNGTEVMGDKSLD